MNSGAGLARGCAWVWVVAGVLLLIPIRTSGDIFTFTDRSEFLNAPGVLASEGFESLAATNVVALTSIGVDDFTISANGAFLGVFDQDQNMVFATEGNQYVIVFNISGGFTLTFDFDSPINAVGLDLIDFESGPDSALAFSYIGSTFEAAVDDSNGGQEFFGIIDTENTFSQFQLINPSGNAGDGVGIDAVLFGNAIPEPATGLLLVGCILIAGCVRRRA